MWPWLLAAMMMPEAFQNDGPWVATAVGFACALLLTRLVHSAPRPQGTIIACKRRRPPPG